ncbi:hypothetical protein QR680_018527 [Steinernema hermaphroditum]|uniref:ATP-dependent RNA helicase n=1 Tax=Steinernema hermaphroditum TaxID=289476 RepID=A0AA39HI85_9BILA|nr:hypothetical protein QR680_018527 [Steinernema hermaphroditum]
MGFWHDSYDMSASLMTADDNGFQDLTGTSSDSSDGPEIPFVTARSPKRRKKRPVLRQSASEAPSTSRVSRASEPSSGGEEDIYDGLLHECPVEVNLLKESSLSGLNTPAQADGARPPVQRRETFFGCLSLPRKEDLQSIETYLRYFIQPCLPITIGHSVRQLDIFNDRTEPGDEKLLERRGQCCARSMEVEKFSEADLESKKRNIPKTGLPLMVQHLYLEGQRSENLISRNYSCYLLSDDTVDGMRPTRNAHTQDLNYLEIGGYFDELMDTSHLDVRGGDGTTMGCTFESLSHGDFVDPTIVKNAKRLRIRNFTAIQSVIMYLMTEKFSYDVIAQAEAGTGKTCVYLIALVSWIFKFKAEEVKKNNKWRPPAESPYAIVVVPNRELAGQISCFANELTKGMKYQVKVSVAVTYGGMDLRTARKHIKSGCDIIVGTPQRLLSHFQCGFLKTDLLHWAVLDETDELLKPRLEENSVMDELLNIVKKTGKTRLYAFGALLTMEIVTELKVRWMRPDPFEVSSREAPTSASHYFVELETHTKRTFLQNFLKVLRNGGIETPKMIIFVDSPTKCEFLYYLLHYTGFPCLIIHSGMLQYAREFVLDQFAKGVVAILIATDIVSRGLNFKNVKYIINYDFPDDIEHYLHRSGRAGRLGNVASILTMYEVNKEREVLRAAKIIPGLISIGLRPASILYYYYSAGGPIAADILRDLQEYEKSMAELDAVLNGTPTQPEAPNQDEEDEGGVITNSNAHES